MFARRRKHFGTRLTRRRTGAGKASKHLRDLLGTAAIAICDPTGVLAWDGVRGMYESPLYATYSLLLALCFGTMGLPHVLVRFYTNPDGRAARQTTVVVLGLLGRLLPVPTPVRRPGPELRARLEALDLREICLLTTL